MPLHEMLEPRHLAEAVAEPARERAIVAVAQPDLVFDCRERLIAELAELLEHTAQGLARGKLARRPVGPRGRAQTDAPSLQPRELADRGRIGVDDQVAGARPDAKALVVGDRSVERVEREQQVGHHGPVRDRGLERVRAQRLALDRTVEVGHAEQDEALAPAWLADRGRQLRQRSLGHDSECLIARPTAAIAEVKRSIISSRSPSLATNAGASST